MAFSGCTVDSCSRMKKGKKTRANYIIEETCTTKERGECPFSKEKDEEDKK